MNIKPVPRAQCVTQVAGQPPKKGPACFDPAPPKHTHRPHPSPHLQQAGLGAGVAGVGVHGAPHSCVVTGVPSQLPADLVGANVHTAPACKQNVERGGGQAAGGRGPAQRKGRWCAV